MEVQTGAGAVIVLRSFSLSFRRGKNRRVFREFHPHFIPALNGEAAVNPINKKNPASERNRAYIFVMLILIRGYTHLRH